MNTVTQNALKYAYEDFTPGTRFELGPHTISAEEIIDFAAEFDAQPMHLEETAGKASLLGGLAASGWQTSAILMRMICDAFLLETASQGSPGVDFAQWRSPVLAGDRLHGNCEVLAARPLASRPGLGLVKFRHELFNQREQLVLACENPIFVARRQTENKS
ncbi:MAG: MaoC family dehydratase [Alphaproteobacteria bacterium]|nr:MaoC family dehydratase [Alphaproteobacteria bacterium]